MNMDYTNKENSSDQKNKNILNALDEAQKQNKELKTRVDEQTKELREVEAKAKELSLSDSLTNLHNRRYFDSVLNLELKRIKRYPSKLMLFLISVDVDLFKEINDQYGHHAGDHVLVQIAQILRECTRDGDCVCRFEGDEFLLLLNSCSLEMVEKISKRILEQVKMNTVAIDSHQITLSLSLGITNIRENDSDESILKRADQALYQAKENGRNQYQIA